MSRESKDLSLLHGRVRSSLGAANCSGLAPDVPRAAHCRKARAEMRHGGSTPPQGFELGPPPAYISVGAGGFGEAAWTVTRSGHATRGTLRVALRHPRCVARTPTGGAGSTPALAISPQVGRECLGKSGKTLARETATAGASAQRAIEQPHRRAWGARTTARGIFRTEARMLCERCGLEPATVREGERDYCRDCFELLVEVECLTCDTLFLTHEHDTRQCDGCAWRESTDEQRGVDDWRDEVDAEATP